MWKWNWGRTSLAIPVLNTIFRLSGRFYEQMTCHYGDSPAARKHRRDVLHSGHENNISKRKHHRPHSTQQGRRVACRLIAKLSTTTTIKLRLNMKGTARLPASRNSVNTISYFLMLYSRDSCFIIESADCLGCAEAQPIQHVLT